MILFVNQAPIAWLSKRQTRVESSTFGSETVVLRIAIDMIESLRCKLHMMVVSVDEAMMIFCDNDAVVKSTSKPESTRKKKHNAVNWHRCMESQAAGWCRLAWLGTNMNLADLFTKTLPGPTRKRLLERILW